MRKESWVQEFLAYELRTTNESIPAWRLLTMCRTISIQSILNFLLLTNAILALLLSGCSEDNRKGSVAVAAGGQPEKHASESPQKQLPLKKDPAKEAGLEQQRNNRILFLREQERKIFERAKVQDKFSNANAASLFFRKDSDSAKGYISPDGAMIAIVRFYFNGNKEICTIYNLITGDPISEFPLDKETHQAVFSGDGKVFVTSETGSDPKIEVRETATGNLKKLIPVQGLLTRIIHRL